jgi:4-alpha-glucanotransferase
MVLLRRAYQAFSAHASADQRTRYDEFCHSQAWWLDDYALFMALKADHGGAPWTAWRPDLAARDPMAITRAASDLAGEVDFHKYLQYQFFRQWQDLRTYANQHGILIIGDVPIFVAHDSADAWAHPDVFWLDERGRPTVVAGVPPDYFSPTGQLWGNPLYRWDVLAQNGYAWWIDRLRLVLTLVDMVRIDHFRGFEAYWEVPATETTAVHGRWVPGPGAAFFAAVEQALGKLPIIAEDLGVITPAVEELRDRFGFPGMKVLQFAFGSGPNNPYLPHNYPRACVVYTGTHDNDTTLGWFAHLSPEERADVLDYLGTDGHDIVWDLIRLAYSSVATLAIIPLQDILGLDSSARMNVPSRASGNWAWRFTWEMVQESALQRIAHLAYIYGRSPVTG